MTDRRHALALIASLALATTVFAAEPNDEALFVDRCGACHLEQGMGTNTLMSRVGPERALLAERSDLTAAYVQLAVRQGIGRMPFLTRVDVTDDELEAIAGYLSRKR